METKPLTFSILPDSYAVCRLTPGTQPPEWNKHTEFYSITHSKNEITMVCLSKDVPEKVQVERDWRVLEILGPLNFSLTGILASVTTPLAEAGIPVFAISTFDTDFILVREEALDRTVDVLRTAGHRI